MPIAKTLTRLLEMVRGLVRIGFAVSALPVVLLAPLVVVDATARKLLGVALPGTLEIGQYSIFAITFLAGPWLLRHRRHVRLETLLALTSGRLRAGIESLGFTIGAAASALMTWQGIRLAAESLRDGTVLYGQIPVPAFWMYLFIPVGSLLYLIEFCWLAARSLPRRGDSRQSRPGTRP